MCLIYSLSDNDRNILALVQHNKEHKVCSLFFVCVFYHSCAAINSLVTCLSSQIYAKLSGQFYYSSCSRQQKVYRLNCMPIFTAINTKMLMLLTALQIQSQDLKG